MPTLNDLIGVGTDPNQTFLSVNNILIEPLDGPTSVDDVMDRFPAEVYQQGRDSHLYRFLSALCGDSGAGLAKAQAGIARLTYEAEFIAFQVLDQIYVAQFSFRRLASEIYNYDATADALTPTQWDAIQLADQSYFARIQEFWTAIRYGNSPMGMALAAQAGSGIDCDIVEHYKFIYDQYSDDPLGLAAFGISISPEEFVVVPRFAPNNTYSYGVNRERIYTFTPPVLNASVHPVPAPTGGDVLKVATTYGTIPDILLKPDIERNVVNTLDRLRPVTTFFSVAPEDTRYTVLDVDPIPVASSERINVTRFITGNISVPWPPINTSQNFFIVGGIETEAGYYYGTNRDLPIIFLSVGDVRAYGDAAEQDPTYGTSAFYESDDSGLTPFDSYRSEQTGSFFPVLSAIFPFVFQVSSDAIFDANQAIANQDTPLVMEGQVIA